MMLKERFNKEIAPELRKILGEGNIMAVPRLHKIVVSCCTSEGLKDIKILDKIAKDISSITGQQPILRRAKKDIANFKIRKGNPLGYCVTLRGDRMYEFFNRLVNVALPRVRDFRGIANSGCDGNGNFSLGIREHVIFPEINFDTVDKVRGLTISIVTTANTDEECLTLLKALGMPFRKDGSGGQESTH